jgi:hypothetical protein
MVRRVHGCSRSWRTAVVWLALLLFGGPAAAQTAAVLAGTVTDAQGGVLPGTTLTVRNTETGLVRTAAADADGRYRFPALPPGPYTLKAELQGFAPVEVKDITLTIGLELSREVKMSLRGVEESVTVTARSPVVETTKSEVAGVVTQHQIETLPINSRQTLELALLMPGTSEDATRPRKVNTNVGAGGQYFQSAFLVDGVSNQEVIAGEPRQDFPQGAIREFRVNVSQAKAEFGGTTGGVVNIVTKSGTNQASGEAFEFFRDKSLNTMNKFEQLAHDTTGAAKPPFRRNQYGISLGGPLVKDKMHLFGAADLTETNQPITVNTGKPQLYSALEGVFPNKQYRRMAFARFDAQLQTNQSVFVRWGYERDHNTCEGCGGNVSSFSANTVEQQRNSVVAGDTWILSTNVLNEFRFQWAPFRFTLTPPGAQVWTDVGQFPPERFAANTPVYNFPSVTWGSGAGRVQTEVWWEFRDDVTITSSWRGTHTWKMGVASVRGPDFDDTAGNTKGTWTFGADQLFKPNDPTTIANLKNPIQFTATLPPIGTHLANTWFQAYVQDDWKPANNLTLSYGLRYDLQTGVFNEDLDPNSFPRRIPFIDPRSRGDHNNVGPRVGLAWDILSDGKSVFRAGYGLYFRYLWSSFAGEKNNLLQNNIIIRNPAYPDPYQGRDPLAFASTALPNITIMDNSLVNPYANSYNVGFSQALTTNLAVHMDGVYSETEKEPIADNVNTPDPVTRLRPLVEWGQINQFQSIGRLKYRALFARLEKRLANRYQFLVSYTLAKSDDNLPYAGLAASTNVTDANNPGLDYGPSRGDRRHAVVASASFLLPAAVNLGVVWTARSTMAFSARAGVDLNGDGVISDYVPGTTRNQGNRDTAGLLTAVNAYRAARGLAPIPDSQIDTNEYSSVDMRASKFLPVGGTRKIELIAQVFNIFGHDNLLPPASSAGWQENALSDLFGRILTANNRQQAELAIRFAW